MSKEAAQKNLVAIDVGHTLTKGWVQTQLHIYNEKLGLAMTAEQIEMAGSKYIHPLDMPAIQTYRRQSKAAEAKFERIRAEIRTSPPLDSVQEGVKLLISSKNFSLLGYFMIGSQKLTSVIGQYLKNNQFPNCERFVLCRSYEDQLRKVMIDAFFRERGDLIKNRRAVIVDDSIKPLAETACLLAEKNTLMRSLMKRVIIVGFNVDETNKNKLLEGTIDPQLGLQTLTLPSLERSNIEKLVRALQN